jgi:hypothetical protein
VVSLFQEANLFPKPFRIRLKTAVKPAMVPHIFFWQGFCKAVQEGQARRRWGPERLADHSDQPKR